MNRDIREDVFDLVFTAALEEFVDSESETFYDEEDCAFKPPKNGLRKLKRRAKAREYRYPAPVIYLRRAAVVFLVAATLFAGMMATSVDVRAAVKDTVMEWYDEFVRITFGIERSSDKDIYSLQIGYVPKGYVLSKMDETPACRAYTYENADLYYFIIRIEPSYGTSVYADAEHSEYEVITVNGNEAHCFYNEDTRGGSVVFADGGYSVLLSGNIDKAELIKIAENIK